MLRTTAAAQAELSSGQTLGRAAPERGKRADPLCQQQLLELSDSFSFHLNNSPESFRLSDVLCSAAENITAKASQNFIFAAFAVRGLLLTFHFI